jgi:hypothetical protein
MAIEHFLGKEVQKEKVPDELGEVPEYKVAPRQPGGGGNSGGGRKPQRNFHKRR